MEVIGVFDKSNFSGCLVGMELGLPWVQNWNVGKWRELVKVVLEWERGVEDKKSSPAPVYPIRMGNSWVCWNADGEGTI